MPKDKLQAGPAFARANGLEIAYDTFGDPGKPAMLLIMGHNSQMLMWEAAFCSLLAGRRYTVIRFDNRDVGLSTKLDSLGVPDMEALLQGDRNAPVPYSLEDMVHDAVSLLDALGLESAHVVGASMGGMIGQLMARCHPQRVKTLTSMMSTTGEPAALSGKEAPQQSVFPSTPPRERKAYIEYFLEGCRALRGGRFPLDEAGIQELARQTYERGVSPEGSLRQLAAILASGSRKEILKSLNIPCLVIHGDSDPLIPVEYAWDTAGTIPGSRLHIIKGLGHELPRQVWPEIVQVLTEFCG